MFRKGAPTIAMVGLLIGAAYAALGLPDFGRVGSFLNGENASTEAALSLISVIAWLVILVASLIAVLLAVRTVHTEAKLVSQPWARSILFLVTGLTVLAIGTAHHLAANATPCCGTPSEATQVVR